MRKIAIPIFLLLFLFVSCTSNDANEPVVSEAGSSSIEGSSIVESKPESGDSETVPQPLPESAKEPDSQEILENGQLEESLLPQETPQPPQNNNFEGLTYQGEPVTALYSFDQANRSYQLVADKEDISEIIPLLELLEPVSLESKNAVGFLIFTTEGKISWYLHKSNSDNSAGLLADISQRCNEKYSHHAQWLVYMSPENLVRVEFDGIGGPGYTRKTWPTADNFNIHVDTSEADDLLTVFLFLKGIKVGDNPLIIDGPINPAMPVGVYTMRLTFKTGVIYSILGYDSGLSISSSDMKESINYDCDEAEIQAMRDMMAGLKTAQLTTINW